MREGWLTAARDPRGDVHGVLWDVGFADMRALDQYEQLASGLYTKTQQPVIGERGAKQALVYFGATPDPASPRLITSPACWRRRGIGSCSGDDRPARVLRRRSGSRSLWRAGERRARATHGEAGPACDRVRHAFRPGLIGLPIEDAVADRVYKWPRRPRLYARRAAGKAHAGAAAHVAVDERRRRDQRREFRLRLGRGDPSVERARNSSPP